MPTLHDATQLLRADPALAHALRAQIRSGIIPGAVWVGRFGNEKDRSTSDLVNGGWSALTRRERLELRFTVFGPRAWERAREILDGEVGEPLHSRARILGPVLVARAAAAMRKDSTPAPARGVEAIADAVRSLLRASGDGGDHVLVLGPSRTPPIF